MNYIRHILTSIFVLSVIGREVYPWSLGSAWASVVRSSWSGTGTWWGSSTGRLLSGSGSYRHYMVLGTALACLGFGWMYLRSKKTVKKPGEPLKKKLKKINVDSNQAAYPWPLLFAVHDEVVHPKEVIQRYYEQDCKKEAVKNADLPKKVGLRVATFNLYNCQGLWGNQSDQNIQHELLKIIKLVNPDVIAFEEIGPGLTGDNTQNWLTLLEKHGYLFTLGNSKAVTPETVIAPCMIAVRDHSRIMMQKIDSFEYQSCGQSGEKRGYVRVNFTIPCKGGLHQSVVVYGTHLEVSDEVGTTREQQMRELLADVASWKEQHPDDMIVIMGDFNAIDIDDYVAAPNMGARMLAQRMAYLESLSGDMIPVHPSRGIFELLEQSGFIDVFKHADAGRPRWTTWTGTRVDWIFVQNSQRLETRAGVYYPVVDSQTPPLSDHILVYADLF